MACNNTAEMPPGAVSALTGTKIMKVTSTTDSNSIIFSHGSINLMTEGGGGWVSTDALVAIIGNTHQRTYYAAAQSQFLDYRLRL